MEVTSIVILVAACPTIGLLVYVAWEMRAQGRAFERFARSTIGLLRVGVVVGTPRPMPSGLRNVTFDSPAAPSERGEGVLVDVEFSPDQRFDSTGGRWLKHVLGASLSTLGRPDEDTPAPPGQRMPILPAQPPPSSPGPRCRQQ